MDENTTVQPENVQKKEQKQPKEKSKGNPLLVYLKGAIEEVKKVTWPSRQEAWKKSWIVIWFSLGFVVFLGALDYVMNELLDILI